MRYTAPVSLSDERWAGEDIAIHGEMIHKGDMVLISLVAVNGDPRHFPDPALLDLARQENQHLAFGKGIHYCLGAPLARLEAQIAIPALFATFADLRLATGEVEWHQNFVLRGLKALPVRFSKPTAEGTT